VRKHLDDPLPVNSVPSTARQVLGPDADEDLRVHQTATESAENASHTKSGTTMAVRPSTTWRVLSTDVDDRRTGILASLNA